MKKITKLHTYEKTEFCSILVMTSFGMVTIKGFLLICGRTPVQEHTNQLTVL